MKIYRIIVCALTIILFSTTTNGITVDSLTEKQPLHILYFEKNDKLLDANKLLDNLATARDEKEIRDSKNFKLSIGSDLKKEK